MGKRRFSKGKLSFWHIFGDDFVTDAKWEDKMMSKLAGNA